MARDITWTATGKPLDPRSTHGHRPPFRTKAVMTMSTIPLAPGTNGWTHAFMARPDSVCWCGQDLDVARHAHCPRCGRRRFPSRREVLAV
jgi:hypothetical protein